MITKQLGKETFAWEPNAFVGKGYWFVLGKKGGLGRAATKEEYSTLGKPSTNEIDPVSPKVYEEKPAKEQPKQQPKKEKQVKVTRTKKKKSGLSSVIEQMLEGKGLSEIARDAAVKKAGELGEKTLNKSKEMLGRFNPFGKKKKEDKTKLGSGIVKKMLGQKGETTQDVTELKSNETPKISKILDEEKNNVVIKSTDTIKEKKSKKKDPLKTTVAPKGSVKLQKGESASNVLAKIYALINEDFENTKLHDELAKNFEEDKKSKADKRHKELIEALGGIGGTVTPVDGKGKEKKDSGGSWFDMIMKWKDQLMEMLGPIFDIVKNFGSVLINVAKFFLTSPIGLALLAGATIMTLLYRDKDPEATNKGIENAGKADGGVSEAIMDAKSDEASQRRAVLLRKAHEEGKIKASWWEFKKAGKEENDYLKSIGFDTKTGLTQKDRDNGFNAVDEEGNPYFSKSRAKSTTQTPSAESSTNTSGVNGLSGTPGTPGTAGAAGASATPSEGSKSTPSASPVASSGGTSTDSATPASSSSATPAATPMSVPKQSDAKLQAVTKENADLNLDKNSGGSESSSPVVVNNSNTTNAPPKAGMTTPENMYNSDPSFRDSLKSSFSRMLG